MILTTGWMLARDDERVRVGRNQRDCVVLLQ